VNNFHVERVKKFLKIFCADIAPIPLSVHAEHAGEDIQSMLSQRQSYFCIDLA
jgi:hypothetical protein